MDRSSRRHRAQALGPALAVAAALVAIVAGPASGAMRSAQVEPGLCETTGGGRIVPIPGFPGERIDRRLLDDVRLLVRRYRIFVTDGYSRDPVHAPNGEHPMGLALDIVPDKAAGGRWSHIDRLARWAEPRRNRPRAPFRWVGYDGDRGHGRGHHLHLSWNHSPTRPGRIARTVLTSRCPDGSGPGGGGGTGGGASGGAGATGGGTGVGEASGGGVTSGGIGGKFRLRGPVIESGGVGLAR